MFRIIILLILINLVNSTLPNAPQTQGFLNAHNSYRTHVYPPAKYMPLLIWSNPLASSSNNWTNKCLWGHSRTPHVGENIYATSVRTPNSTKFNPIPVVVAWGSEYQYYNYWNNTCQTGKVCGHYTQIIWANTSYLGCSFKDCPTIQGIPWPNGGTLVTCQYYPQGNWVGQRPYVQK